MDILGNLPLEISQQIILFLNAEEVGRCCFVCNRWREIANNDHIWYKLCLSNGIDVNEEIDQHTSDVAMTYLMPQCKWGRIFNSYFSSLISNWSSSACERFEIPYREQSNGHSVPRITTDGVTIVLGDSEGVIDIWRVKKGRRCVPSHIQRITIPQRTVSKVITNTNFIIAVLDTIYILVYELRNGKYSLITGFHTKAFPTFNGTTLDRFVYKKSSQSLSHFLTEVRSSTLMVHMIGLFGNNLFLKTNLHCVFLWSLKPFLCRKEINTYSHDCTVTTYKNCLYVYYKNRIVAYNKQCTAVKEYMVSGFIPDTGNRYISSLHFNNNLISAISGDYRDLKEINRKLIVWDKNSCREVCAKVLLLYEYAFLHPTRDVLYIIHQIKGSKYLIKAWQPFDDSILWLALHSSELDAYHFGSVGLRFIIFFTHLDHNYFVFDSKSGKKRPLLINGSNSSIIHYSNNSFLLAETRSLRTFTIFSFIN